MKAYALGPRAALLAALALAACSDDAGSGRLTVLLEAETTITAGLDAGDGEEDIQDGWSARFDRYVVGIGAIDLRYATDPSRTASDPRVFVVDLTAVPDSGLSLWELDGLDSGRWEFGYTVAAAPDAVRHTSVDEADYARVTSEALSHLVSGSLTKADGRSCPPRSLASVPEGAVENGENAGGDPCYDNAELRFTIAASADTVYGPCEVDDVPGVAVVSDGTTSVSATLHGDHLFFNGFPEGDEGGVRRLAQWLADSDLNLDGEVTRDELERIAPADLPEFDERYQLGGSPLRPLDDLWTYVRAQLKTQGHMDGEGECAPDGLVE